MLVQSHAWQHPYLERQRRLMSAFRTLQEDPEVKTSPNLSLLRAATFHDVDPGDLLAFAEGLGAAQNLTHIGASHAHPR